MLAVLAILRHGPSFEAVFREHYPRIVAFFRRRGCSTDDGEELAQETFLRAFGGWSDFRGDAKAGTWLLTIATNLWLNRQRAAKALKRAADKVSLDAADAVDPPADSSPDREALDTEQRRRLRAAIDQLSPAMRRCVLLRVYQERSYREIGELLGVHEDTAKSQVSRARAELRKILAGHVPELVDAADRKS